MLFCAAVLQATVSARAALEVVERGGALSVTRDGRTVVSSVAVDRGEIGSDDVKGSFAEQPDGGTTVVLPKELLKTYTLIRLT